MTSFFYYFGSRFILLGASVTRATVCYMDEGSAMTAGSGGDTIGTIGTFLGSSTILVETNVIKLFKVILYLGWHLSVISLKGKA